MTAQYPRDDEYYMPSIVFLVEGYLFRVPRYYFASCSDIFSSVFSLPLGEKSGEEAAEGSSDERPFLLEGISRSDFKGFLRVMYPLQTTILGGEPALPKSEWIAALKLSTLWNFRDIRALSITRLSDVAAPNTLTSIEKITLGKTYKVTRWLEQGYHELVRRAQSISSAEAKCLGIETTVGLYQIREQIAAVTGPTSHGHPEFSFGYHHLNRREVQDFMHLVRKGFKEELEEVDAAGKVYNTLPTTA